MKGRVDAHDAAYWQERVARAVVGVHARAAALAWGKARFFGLFGIMYIMCLFTFKILKNK